MKYRKGIEPGEATEEELLRYQMVNIVRTSRADIENLGECSVALTKIYNSLKYRYTRILIGFLVSLYLIIGFFVLIEKLFWRKRR